MRLPSRSSFLLSLQVILESMRSAFIAIAGNKIRSLLSTLGISIGIFCIIVVLTLVDSLKKNIYDSINALGSNMVIVQKWPFIFGGDYPWWKFVNRPIARYSEFERLSSSLEKEAVCCLFVNFGAGGFKYEQNTASNPTILACTKNYERIRSFEIAYGRYMSDLEILTGANTVVIGYDIAEGLFIDPEKALGKTISMDGKKLVVIGVTKKEGSNLLQTSMDNAAIINYNYLKGIFSMGHNGMEPNIYVKPLTNVSIDYIRDEVRKNMRAVRRLPPGAEDNFAINEFSMITNAFDSLFSILKVVGWFVGFFSILVGCFGVANIMFVSVKERTNLIGIQKALGAKNSFIFIQFLVEAIILCLIGGTVGMALVGLAVVIANYFEFTIYLSAANIILGFTMAVIIGVVSGIIPAIGAARLDPVEAIRSK